MVFAKKLLDKLIRVVLLLSFLLGGVVFFLKNPVFDVKGAQNLLPTPDEKQLTETLQFLTKLQPPRNLQNLESLNQSANYIFEKLKSYGYEPKYQEFEALGQSYKNIIATFNPNRFAPLVVGAHYDVAHDTPGADDNGSGVAALLEIARLLKESEALPQAKLKNSVELVFYSLEEPPAFRTRDMGSYHHAFSLAKANREIQLMISIECVGYFSQEPQSQSYPLSLLKWIFPEKGHFLAVVGKTSDWLTARKVKSLFRLATDLPVESLNAPAQIEGVDYSDHLNYWQFNYPALMVTDTAFFRNSHYHKKSDTLETLDIKSLAKVVTGLLSVILHY